MCGRFVQTKPARDRVRFLTMREAPPRPETWNLAPTTLSIVVRDATPDGMEATWLSWGIKGGVGFNPINVRIETAATKFPFRDAWQSRRCLVPADGWYEWHTVLGKKQPYYFSRLDGEAILFGGLWTGDSFCLITSEADGDLATIHHRRPLSVRDHEAETWIHQPQLLLASVLALAIPPGEIAFHAVRTEVGSPRNDDPSMIQPI